MNAQHTPGQLFVGSQNDYPFVIDRAPSVGGNDNPNHDADTEVVAKPFAARGCAAVANARRIVACWNACDGIDTSMLEGFSPRFLARVPDRALAERRAIEAQRDALHALLVELMETELGKLACIGSDAPVEDLLGRIQAAIGKPQSEQPAANNEPATNQFCPGDLPKCKWEPMQPYGSKCATCGDIVPF